MRYIPARLLLPVILLLTGIDPCHALQVEAPASDELRIKADTIGYDARKDSYTATGKVRIDWQGSTMFADSVSLLQKGVMASADGNVLVRKDDNTIQGDSAFLNLETGKGEINNGRLFIPQGNFRISGKKMKKPVRMITALRTAPLPLVTVMRPAGNSALRNWMSPGKNTRWGGTLCSTSRTFRSCISPTWYTP